uniref:Uncharacterized protein n=1 Tax=Glycine max TaxID=3847 RepID=C6T6C9_SOYBN|nr:unknown [Glycine max]
MRRNAVLTLSLRPPFSLSTSPLSLFSSATFPSMLIINFPFSPTFTSPKSETRRACITFSAFFSFSSSILMASDSFTIFGTSRLIFKTRATIESDTMSLMGSEAQCKETCFSDSCFTVTHSWTCNVGTPDSSSTD